MKTPVAILGATGSVGRKFLELLENHPSFEVKHIAASDRSVGKKVGEWTVESCEQKFDVPLVFSALDATVAGEIESEFASKGYLVVTNARNHRMDPNVPLIVPEVNGEKIHTKSRIIANPNCSVIGLTLALKPLSDRFGIESLHVVTLQAISGAGDGVRHLDIEDNVIPFIVDEERKIETETRKILDAAFPITAQCNRVPVSDGHTLCVSLTIKNPAHATDLIEVWESFPPLDLPSAPSQPIHYFPEESFPQPKLHRNLEKGMAISVGRLRQITPTQFQFVVLSHNTIRGAAGGAILCAEKIWSNSREGVLLSSSRKWARQDTQPETV